MIRASVWILSLLLAIPAHSAAVRDLPTGVVSFSQQASAPSSPSSGKLKTYAKSDGKLYTLNSSGTEKLLGVEGFAGSNTFTFTPVLTGFTGGTQTLTKATYWRAGQWMFIDVAYALSGTHTGATSVTLSIPADHQIDTTLLVSSNGTEQLGIFRVPGSSSYFGSVGYNSSGTRVSFLKPGSASNMTGADFAGSNSFTASFKVPILGWDSNVTVVDKFSSLVVASTCSTSPCTIDRQSGAFNSVTRTGSGAYVGSLKAGIYGSKPTCWSNFNNGTSLNVSCNVKDSATSTSQVEVNCQSNASGASTDASFTLLCKP